MEKECNHEYEVKEVTSDQTSTYTYSECKHCGRSKFESKPKK